MSQATIDNKRVTRASSIQHIVGLIEAGTKQIIAQDDKIEASRQKLAGKKRLRPTSPTIEEEALGSNEEFKEFKQNHTIEDGTAVICPKKKRGRPAKVP